MTARRLAELRRRMLTASRWVLVVVYGGFFAVFWTLYNRFGQGEEWALAVILGLLAGALFGLLMGWWQHREYARLREAAGDPTGEELAGLPWRWHRTVPEDPDQRARVLAVATHYETVLRGQRRWAVPFFVLMLALAVWLAVAESPWWWLGVAVWTVFLPVHLLVPRRLRRYADRLRAAG